MPTPYVTRITEIILEEGQSKHTNANDLLCYYSGRIDHTNGFFGDHEYDTVPLRLKTILESIVKAITLKKGPVTAAEVSVHFDKLWNERKEKL